MFFTEVKRNGSATRFITDSKMMQRVEHTTIINGKRCRTRLRSVGGDPARVDTKPIISGAWLTVSTKTCMLPNGHCLIEHTT